MGKNAKKILLLVIKLCLKKRVCSDIKFNDLSLWWLSNLVNRDNVNNQGWYEDLNKIFNNKKIKYNYNFLYARFLIKFIKNLVLKFIFTLFIKIFLKIKKNHFII